MEKGNNCAISRFTLKVELIIIMKKKKKGKRY